MDVRKNERADGVDTHDESYHHGGFEVAIPFAIVGAFFIE